jgi:hypothetical protein
MSGSEISAQRTDLSPSSHAAALCIRGAMVREHHDSMSFFEAELCCGS